MATNSQLATMLQADGTLELPYHSNLLHCTKHRDGTDTYNRTTRHVDNRLPEVQRCIERPLPVGGQRQGD
jgi:hypothetical protein